MQVITKKQVLVELLGGTSQDFVLSCYRSILLREPDPEGLSHYLSRVLSGEERLAIAADIASSKEAQRLPPSAKRLITEILAARAEALVRGALSKKQRAHAAQLVSHYLWLVSGFTPGGTGATSAGDPFAEYLHGVIEAGSAN